MFINLGQRSKDHRDLRGDHEPRGGGADEEEPQHLPIQTQQQHHQQQQQQRPATAQQVRRRDIQYNVSLSWVINCLPKYC